MADVTGPISSMPGSLHRVPAGMACDDHPEVLATHRVQGETDSFGCEMIDMCDACYTQFRLACDIERTKRQETESMCDWCKTSQRNCRARRDMDEGMTGPLYNVCPSCIQRDNERAREELAYLEDSGDDYDPFETCEGDWDD